MTNKQEVLLLIEELGLMAAKLENLGEIADQKYFPEIRVTSAEMLRKLSRVRDFILTV